MNYAAETEIMREKNKPFITVNDWLMIIILALIGTYINYIPYSNRLSIVLQAALLGGILVLYRSRPAMLIVAYILLSLLPLRMSAGFLEGASNIYTLNSRICIAFTLLFFFYGLVIQKRSYRIVIPMLFFVLFMICSLLWTVSPTWYDYDFWWMCTAYLFLPMFIQEDNDIRLVTVAYILAVDIFCINILPLLTAETDLYRGVVNLDPNYAALFLLIGVAIVFSLLTQYNLVLSRKYKLFLLGSIILAVVTMSYFASRTSFIMLALLLMLYLLFNYKRVKTLFLALAGFILLYFVLDMYGFFNAVLMRFGMTSTETAGGRLIIQSELLHSLFNSDTLRVFFGNGYLTASKFALGLEAHNTYVSILHGFGLVGLFIYGFYLLSMFRTLNFSDYKPFLILFYCLIFYGFALEPYHMSEGITLFCLLSGITILASRPWLNDPEQSKG